MAKRKKKNEHSKPSQNNGKADVLLTPEEILEHSTGYQLMRKFFSGVLVACLICATGSLLLRMNFQDLAFVALFLTVLTYLFMGTAVFLWFVRILPLKKQARQIAAEHNAQYTGEETVDGRTVISVKDTDADKSTLFSRLFRRKKEKSTQSPEYLKYRRIWRVFLFLSAMMVLAAYFSLNLYTEQSMVPLVLLFAAYLPIAAAIYIYNKHLKPLKQAWEEKNRKNA